MVSGTATAVYKRRVSARQKGVPGKRKRSPQTAAATKTSTSRTARRVQTATTDRFGKRGPTPANPRAPVQRRRFELVHGRQLVWTGGFTAGVLVPTLPR